MAPMSRCELWLAATMKWVWAGMCSSPSTLVSQHPLKSSCWAAEMPLLPRRATGSGTFGCRRRPAPRPARAGGARSCAPAATGPLVQELVHGRDVAGGAPVQLLGHRHARPSPAPRPARCRSGCPGPARSPASSSAATARGRPVTSARMSRNQPAPVAPLRASPVSACPWAAASAFCCRRTSSATTSRRLIDRLAVLGSSPSQNSSVLTRFQNGSPADTVWKCSLDLRLHLGPAQRRLVFQVGDHSAGDVLGGAVGQADHGDLLDERGFLGTGPRSRRGTRSCRWSR